MARKDKLRFEVEKSLYTGPWKVPAKKRSQKDPNAPKRPMSAFLAYSHAKRAEVKAKNPGMNNAEISRILAQMWKDAPEEEKKEHIEKEYELRQKYLSEIAVWRENTEKELTEQRKHREEIALKTVAARGNSHDQIEGQQLASDKDGQPGAAGYGGYYQGSAASQYYGGSAPPGAYGQDYRGYPPYYPPPGQHDQYGGQPPPGGPPDSAPDGAYPSHHGAEYYPPSNYGYYPPGGGAYPPPQEHQYPGGYGGGYGGKIIF